MFPYVAINLAIALIGARLLSRSPIVLPVGRIKAAPHLAGRGK
jgi:hypothetical protein